MTDEEQTAKLRAQMREIEARGGLQMKADMEFRRRLTPETDRGAALSVRAYLEHRLGQLLRATLVQNPKVHKELFEGNGPMATFSNRIKVAYSIGLLSAAEMRDLNLIRAVANDFAHEPEDISFAHPHVVSRCSHLSGASLYRDAQNGARRVFVTTAMSLLGGFGSRSEERPPFEERKGGAFDGAFKEKFRALAAGEAVDWEGDEDLEEEDG